MRRRKHTGEVGTTSILPSPTVVRGILPFGPAQNLPQARMSPRIPPELVQCVLPCPLARQPHPPQTLVLPALVVVLSNGWTQGSRMCPAARPPPPTARRRRFEGPTRTRRLSCARNSRGRSASEDHLGPREGTLAPHVSGVGGHFFLPGGKFSAGTDSAGPEGGATQPEEGRGGRGGRRGTEKGARGVRASGHLLVMYLLCEYLLC